jgi:hypothetical protein
MLWKLQNFTPRKVRKPKMDKVAGFLQIDRRDDTHEIVISHPGSKPDAEGLVHIILLPRHARHLANLLVEYATYAEAEIVGLLPESRRYRRVEHTRK